MKLSYLMLHIWLALKVLESFGSKFSQFYSRKVCKKKKGIKSS